MKIILMIFPIHKFIHLPSKQQRCFPWQKFVQNFDFIKIISKMGYFSIYYDQVPINQNYFLPNFKHLTMINLIMDFSSQEFEYDN